VTFYSPTADPDEYGNTVEGWTEEFTVWARLQPLKGGEDVMADRLSGKQPFVVHVRRSTDAKRITTDWRMVDARDATRVLYVKSPPADMDEMRSNLQFIAETGVAG